MNSSDRLDRLETLAETLATGMINVQDHLIRTVENVDRLAQIVNQERERTNSVLARQDAIITSINAELERQGRILDYLIRRDQNGNDNNPE